MNHLGVLLQGWPDLRTALFWALWGIDTAWGTWTAFRARKLSRARAEEGVGRLARGLTALLVCHMAMTADMDTLWALVCAGGVSGVQVCVIAPVLCSILQHCGVLPKPVEAAH